MVPPDKDLYNGTAGEWCTANETGVLWNRYCKEENETTVCDEYFLNSNISWIPGIPGMFSGQLVGMTCLKN